MSLRSWYSILLVLAGVPFSFINFSAGTRAIREILRALSYNELPISRGSSGEIRLL